MTDGNSSSNEVAEWLRRLKVQCECVRETNESRTRRHVIPRMFQIEPDEMLRVLSLAFDGALPVEPSTHTNVAPCVRVLIKHGAVADGEMYAPGLPDGWHDVFPVPLNPRGQMIAAPWAEQVTRESAAEAMHAEPPDDRHWLKQIEDAKALQYQPAMVRAIQDVVSNPNRPHVDTMRVLREYLADARSSPTKEGGQ